MLPNQSELSIPADPAYIVVAKRAAAGFASVAGLDLEAVEDVVIAVAQACQHSIARLERSVGRGVGRIRLDFLVEGQRLDVQVRSVCSRAEIELAHRTREAAIAKQRAAERSRRAAVAAEDVRAAELALQVMGLFVDDFGYRVNDRTGATHVRLTKYRVA